jgi:heme exporter protein A
VLTAVDLTLWRGPHCLFEDLSLGVEPGSAAVVRGPNGSGKTTLLRVLCGLTRPESGQVYWGGENIESHRHEYGAQLAYFGHAKGLKADLTVEQNLSFFTRLNGGESRDNGGRTRVSVLQSLDLYHCADLELRYLSAGQQRRAALARLLMSGARLWIMDEPFANLDDAGRAFVEACVVDRLDRGGMAVIAAHHDLNLGNLPVQAVELEGTA